MTRREEARIARSAYTAHVRTCDRCADAQLCPEGRGLELDADAAGWRADNLPERVPYTPPPPLPDWLTIEEVGRPSDAAIAEVAASAYQQSSHAHVLRERAVRQERAS